MSIRGFSESNYLHRAEPVVPNERPYRVMAKVRLSNENTVGIIFRQGIDLGGSNFIDFYYSNEGHGSFRARHASSLPLIREAVASDGEAILDTWLTGIAEFRFSSGRSVMSTFFRSTSTGSSSNTEYPTDTYLGALSTASPDIFKLAEVSVWDSDGIGWFNNDAAYRAGHQMKANRHPLEMNADEESEWYGRLVAYWPLDNLTTGIQDHSGNGHHMSVVGTLIVDEDHPLYAGEPTPPPPSKRIIIG